MLAVMDDLPLHVVVQIMSFFTLQDKFKLMSVSRKWRAAAESSLLSESVIHMQRPYTGSPIKVPKTGITVKNDFNDLAFWRGIWRKVPNVDTVYFDAAIEDLHRPGPDPWIFQDRLLMRELFTSLATIKKLIAPNFDVIDWPYQSGNLEILHVMSIDEESLDKLTRQSPRLKELQVQYTGNITSWKYLPYGMTHLLTSVTNLSDFATNSPAASTIEVLREVVVEGVGDIPTTPFPNLIDTTIDIRPQEGLDPIFEKLSRCLAGSPRLEYLEVHFWDKCSDSTWTQFVASIRNVKQLKLIIQRKFPDLRILCQGLNQLERFSIQTSDYNCRELLESLRTSRSLKSFSLSSHKSDFKLGDIVEFLNDMMPRGFVSMSIVLMFMWDGSVPPTIDMDAEYFTSLRDHMDAFGLNVTVSKTPSRGQDIRECQEFQENKSFKAVRIFIVKR